MTATKLILQLFLGSAAGLLFPVEPVLAITQPSPTESTELGQMDPLLTMVISGDALAAETLRVGTERFQLDARAMFLAMSGREAQADAMMASNPDASDYAVGLDDSIVAVWDNSLDVIEQLAPDYQIIILNEAHHSEQHRLFLAELITRLYDLGYDVLSLEALLSVDPSIPATTPIRHNQGLLTNSPALAFAANTMAELGGSIFGHEQTYAQDEMGMDREVAQAQNLANIYRLNTGHKIIAYVGHEHVVENRHSMARLVSGYADTDPLTVDQVRGGHLTGVESLAALRNSVEVAGSPLDALGHPVAFTDGSVDVVVFHPVGEALDGRPSWYGQQFGRTRVDVSQWLDEAPYPILVEARPVGRAENTVPVDRIIITEPSHTISLMLLPGEYEIVIRSPAGLNQHYLVVEHG